MEGQHLSLPAYNLGQFPILSHVLSMGPKAAFNHHYHHLLGIGHYHDQTYFIRGRQIGVVSFGPIEQSVGHHGLKIFLRRTSYRRMCAGLAI